MADEVEADGLTAEEIRTWWADMAGRLNDHGMDIAQVDDALFLVGALLERALISGEVDEARTRMRVALDDGSADAFDETVAQVMTEASAMMLACCLATEGSPSPGPLPGFIGVMVSTRDEHLAKLGGVEDFIRGLAMIVGGGEALSDLVRPETPTTAGLKAAQTLLAFLHACEIVLIGSFIIQARP